ncbi:MAG TPA: dephospho-CoA kinase [Deltaproteobacteria bacterium]|nr:MAG: dephospho-CoA kinase [Deltaproteobacteria bacterium GWA2_55_82]OGQ62292.1 MAG: dephospho-CoA kinase [Deltaproteobacteria bacterium RIFCSPLOWO2_02_FULL_55_12]OIJ74404.1 MAG: dephospho-CoA kinase [Deltaproteobacteria bacterium GWC2_55_46]HBG47054.1 dephospho-CoA kinase [Deltaproteobacteria bacterium]HCY10887.1 dephospho-CoA kinase [Deltaproteobacteria bacterium]
MIVGLTGGIATGKSLVSGEMERLGARVIDADVIAREIVEPGKPAYDEIVEEFGEGILGPSRSLDRKALGDIVFRDREALGKLNRITHPRIRQRIREEIAKAREDEIVVVDIALLIETGFIDEVDKVIVVAAVEERQIERMLKRNGLTRQQALQRLSCQLPVKEKLEYADYVIENNGTIEDAMERTREVWRELKAAMTTMD